MDGWWVLVADDEELVRWSLRECLEDNGYRVLGAENGRQALERHQDADVLLLDYRLPDVDGLSVARAVKQARPSCPVILMTAYGSPELVEEAAAGQIHAVIDKPFDLQEVVRLVRDALGASRPR